MLPDSFHLAPGSATITTGFSEISRFSVTSGGSWSQWQKSYRLLGSLRGTTRILQRWVPSLIKGKEEETKALGILAGTESWRTGDRFHTHFRDVHTALSSRAWGGPSMQPAAQSGSQPLKTTSRAPSSSASLALAQGLLYLHIHWIH